MFGENRNRLVTIRCVTCQKWVALRVDPEALERHVKRGVYVQSAFIDRNGRPYLDPFERELFISAVCGSCYSLLCPSDRLAYN